MYNPPVRVTPETGKITEELPPAWLVGGLAGGDFLSQSHSGLLGLPQSPMGCQHESVGDRK